MRYVSYTRTTSCFAFDEIPDGVIGLQNDHIAAYAKEHGISIDKKYSDRKNDTEEKAALRVILRKPYCEIDAENAEILQFLDLIKEVVDISEVDGEELTNRLLGYMKKKNI